MTNKKKHTEIKANSIEDHGNRMAIWSSRQTFKGREELKSMDRNIDVMVARRNRRRAIPYISTAATIIVAALYEPAAYLLHMTAPLAAEDYGSNAGKMLEALAAVFAVAPVILGAAIPLPAFRRLGQQNRNVRAVLAKQINALNA